MKKICLFFSLCLLLSLIACSSKKTMDQYNQIVEYWQMGYFEKALDEISKAGKKLEKNPIIGNHVRWMKADCHFGIAIQKDSLNNKGDIEQLQIAARMIEEVLEDDFQELYIGTLMSCYRNMGNYEEIILLYEKNRDLLEESGSEKQSYYLARIKTGDTLNIIEEVKNSDLKDFAKRDIIYEYYKAQESPEKLEKYFSDILKNEPEKYVNHSRYAQFLLENKKYESALDEINTAFKIRHDNGEDSLWVHFGIRGAILSELGKDKEAKADSASYFSKRRKFFYPE